MHINDKISIIIPTFNSEKTLQETLNSIFKQKDVSVEVIIIDAVSTDNTLKIISYNRDRITTAISEPDKGIYDAMNKGINSSTGNWLFFLGSDDQFSDENILCEMLKANKDLQSKLIFGNMKYSSGKKITCDFSYKVLFSNKLFHQACLYHKDIFKEYRYDINNRIASDYDLSLKLYLDKCKHSYLDKDITICGDEGLSGQGLWVGYKEVMKIYRKYLPLPLSFLLSIQVYIRFIKKRISQL
ncbi:MULTISPECIES: glycosyltransferase family 2 protein [Providencia]|uniref:glycosyltransferase family 2 protein n=1 Tax=Providencia TaxID=586 RepID=UPI00029BD854|nr:MULTISPECIES: glycosyltransferase family 2 protein [Providencia]EKT59806.1 glycosyl transferase family protein [Providencia rettgeri Dmel1]MDH2367470.1 glycosyltransferase family 2 protein [Providencia rettgeri]HEM7188828.1 glycosyltransferase [Providencia rettgeri]